MVAAAPGWRPHPGVGGEENALGGRQPPPFEPYRPSGCAVPPSRLTVAFVLPPFPGQPGSRLESCQRRQWRQGQADAAAELLELPGPRLSPDQRVVLAVPAAHQENSLQDPSGALGVFDGGRLGRVDFVPGCPLEAESHQRAGYCPIPDGRFRPKP